MTRFLPVSAAIFAAILAGAAPAADLASASPTTVVRQLIEAVRGFKEKGDVPLSPAERRHNEDAARIANQTLALLGLSRYVLGTQWQSLSAQQQNDFVALITDLFERIAYPKSSGFFGDLVIEYGGERINGTHAVVETTVRHPKEGLVSIDYKLRREGAHWVIHDILLDEVSLALDLRSQIQKVLREESYARLLARMRDKLTEG